MWAAAALLVGCTESHGGPADGGPDGVVAGDCYEGEMFVECEPVGDAPRFACEEDWTGCRWVWGPGIRPGMHVSDCRARDLCCSLVDEPFDERNETVARQLFEWGSSPWDRSRESVLGVAVDGSLAPRDVVLECSATGGGLCRWPDGQGVIRRRRDTLFFLVTDPETLFGWHLGIEVVTLRDGTRAARACQLHFTDWALMEDCVMVGDAWCATSGTVTLSSWPASDDELAAVALDLEATFPDGLHVHVAF